MERPRLPDCTCSAVGINFDARRFQVPMGGTTQPRRVIEAFSVFCRQIELAREVLLDPFDATWRVCQPGCNNPPVLVPLPFRCDIWMSQHKPPRGRLDDETRRDWELVHEQSFRPQTLMVPFERLPWR